MSSVIAEVKDEINAEKKNRESNKKKLLALFEGACSKLAIWLYLFHFFTFDVSNKYDTGKWVIIIMSDYPNLNTQGKGWGPDQQKEEKVEHAEAYDPNPNTQPYPVPHQPSFPVMGYQQPAPVQSYPQYQPPYPQSPVNNHNGYMLANPYSPHF